MISGDELRLFKEASKNEASPENLTDITHISINGGQDKLSRIEAYLQTVGNPYLFAVGDTVVRLEYGNGTTLQKAVTRLFT